MLLMVITKVVHQQNQSLYCSRCRAMEEVEGSGGRRFRFSREGSWRFDALP